jgi:hypothetical protein
MSLRVRSTAEEAMDAADLPAETYAAVLADLAAVNRLTLARRPTLAFLKRAVGDRGSFRLLDVGFGQGTCCGRSRAGLEGVESRPIWSGST